MILISFFWIMNLKYAFRVNAQIEQESKSLQDFNVSSGKKVTCVPVEIVIISLFTSLAIFAFRRSL